MKHQVEVGDTWQEESQFNFRDIEKNKALQDNSNYCILCFSLGRVV